MVFERKNVEKLQKSHPMSIFLRKKQKFCINKQLAICKLFVKICLLNR